MNIREITRTDPNYFELCREERNYAAILFMALCRANNVERFLKLCRFDNALGNEIGPDFGIYFEYAYLRDLWSTLTNEDAKKEIIRTHLPIKGIDEILRLPPKDINEWLGVGGKASSSFVQYPGRWAIIKYSQNFPDNDDFLKICKFKWSFNIKPDIVIHLDKNHAVCIEGKYESGEGSYPSSEQDTAVFRKRSLAHVGQMDLQKYMMEELLGINSRFVVISNKAQNVTRKRVSWAEVFKCLDMTDMPPFVVSMVERISGSSQ